MLFCLLWNYHASPRIMKVEIRFLKSQRIYKILIHKHESQIRISTIFLWMIWTGVQINELLFFHIISNPILARTHAQLGCMLQSFLRLNIWILRPLCGKLKTKSQHFMISINISTVVCALNPLMPSGAFNICCPRDCVSRTANEKLVTIVANRH